jgi:hypothetical protein
LQRLSRYCCLRERILREGAEHSKQRADRELS